ncbi:hypothetical protein [Halomontanus rarus]|uniref:hypothetical protein n=1 Tax=Halomontanus rarus TaxID=3034020 RepID=UPI00293B99FE|nr:hypothetical protein [Halovivax sp. KZCA124]
MREIGALFAIAGVAGFLGIVYTLIDALTYTLAQVTAGNIEVLGEFILLCVLVMLAVQILSLARPSF